MPEPDGPLRALAPLIGTWHMAAVFPHAPEGASAEGGDATALFEWLPGEQFLVERWQVEAPEAPDGIAIIGPDPAHAGQFLQHYFDSRGVARLYKMTLDHGVWTLWRDEPDLSPLDFRQRYIGTLSDDGNTIVGCWEICHDGTTWEHDFDLTYPARSDTLTPMVRLDDVARMALELPEVTEGISRGWRTWAVGGKNFAWERPFSKADIRRFGDEVPPAGPILAVRVDDLAEKEAVLAAQPKAFFTIPHFDGFAAVLIQLDVVTKRPLRDALDDAWLACAPQKLVDDHLARRRPTRG